MIGTGLAQGDLLDAVDVFIALGVVLGQEAVVRMVVAVKVHPEDDVLPGDAVLIRLGIGVHFHLHKGAVGVPDGGGGAEISALAVPPELEGAVGTGVDGLLGAGVQPTL